MGKDKVDISIVTTKTGDAGVTETYERCKLPKDSLQVAVVGEMDILSAHLGLAKVVTRIQFTEIETIQLKLQHLNSLIMTDPKMDMYAPTIMPTNENYLRLTPITQADVDQLESWEAVALTVVEIKPEFVLPGHKGSVNAHFHLARTQCRRAERYLWRLITAEARLDLKLGAQYINRLSDLLFLYAEWGR
jgi:cob(I)alamin adenosyltransferase